MPKAQKKKTSSKATHHNTEPVFTWAMESSRPRAGGQRILYEVRLNEDGSLSCNCPGWIFKKKSETRGCKHTKIALEHPTDPAKTVFQKWQKGEALPLFDVGISAGTLAFKTGQNSTGTKLGRKVLID